MAGDNMSLTVGDLLAYLESPKFLKATATSTRLVSRLKSDIENNQLYQIHQDLRNIYFRLVNHQEKVEALKDLLYNGATYLLNSGEQITGQDIASILLEVSCKHLQNRLAPDHENRYEAEKELANPSLDFHTSNATVSFSICNQISNITTKLPDTELGRPKFVAEALQILTPKVLNQTLLHHSLANSFWRQRDFVNSRYHFLHCASLENAQDIASLLVEYHGLNAIKSEVDLFIAQFVFQLLCLQSPSDVPKPSGSKKESAGQPNTTVSIKSRSTIKLIAEKVFSTYCLKHSLLSQIEAPFTAMPLLNFTYFIISLLDSQPPESECYKILCDVYKVAWSRDPNYQNYLNRIGTIYFGLIDKQKQQQQQQGGFFNNILMSLFENAEGDDEGDDDNEHPNQSHHLSLDDDLD